MTKFLSFEVRKDFTNTPKQQLNYWLKLGRKLLPAANDLGIITNKAAWPRWGYLSCMF